jgi:hypothetical protein
MAKAERELATADARLYVLERAVTSHADGNPEQEVRLMEAERSRDVAEQRASANQRATQLAAQVRRALKPHWNPHWISKTRRDSFGLAGVLTHAPLGAPGAGVGAAAAAPRGDGGGGGAGAAARVGRGEKKKSGRDAESSLGDAKSSLGDAKSSAGCR